ncbi:MAG: L-seryl-tRNA(Sec) selenium transferase [Planctomycetota bacterium]|nr:L-seryl-tRNA(Sec) selenium transferase [Planctomycetota bacterium]
MANTPLRIIPSVDQTLGEPEVARLIRFHSRVRVVRAVRDVLGDLRKRLRSKGGGNDKIESLLSPRRLSEQIESRLTEEIRPQVCRVLNGTGIVLHTGLGRGPLSPAALAALQQEARGYTRVEVDPESGERGDRVRPISQLLSQICEAEGATVVNNNAAATLLVLATLARGKEVIVSRGQLVEIGGSFRIPDVMVQSGARLVEVGSTNRTRIADYEQAIGPETGLLLRVHTSNYRIVGFTEDVAVESLVRLGRKHGIPVMDDLGSGSFVDLEAFGLKGEPTVQGSMSEGADVITFSGDKLLGGPQAGIIVGRKKVISAVMANPLYRALRVDKLTLIALEATLRLFLEGDRVFQNNLALRLITMQPEEIRKRAEKLAQEVRSQAPDLQPTVVEERSQVGSGSLPTEKLPTFALALRPKERPAHELARDLRLQSPPVFTRLKDDRVLIDLRTILEGEEVELIRALREAESTSPRRKSRSKKK